MTVRVLAVAALLISGHFTPASADSAVTVESAWARASIGTSRPAAAYATIRNDDDAPIALVGMQASISATASIHESATDTDGIARMRPVDALTVPAGGAVALEPGGYHVMLTGLTRPLVEGGTFAALFQFADGTELSVMVPVLGIGAQGPEETPAE